MSWKVSLIAQIDTQEEDVFCIASDNQSPPRLLSGHNNKFKVWKSDGTLEQSIDTPIEGDVTCICVSKSKIAVSVNTSVLLYDPNKLTTLIEHCTYNKDEINQISINESGNFLLACDDTGEIQVLDISTSKPKLYKTCRKHDNICSSITFHPHRHWDMISGGLDCQVILWDYSRGRPYTILNIQEALATNSGASAYLINPPMVHSLCTIGQTPFVVLGLGNGAITLCNTNRSQLELVSTREFHSISIACITCYETKLAPEGASRSDQPLVGASNVEELLSYIVVSGGNDGKIIWSGVTEKTTPISTDKVKLSSKKSKPHHSSVTYEILESPLAIYDHGSKVNWITILRQWNEKHVVVVADQTSVITLYSIEQ